MTPANMQQPVASPWSRRILAHYLKMCGKHMIDDLLAQLIVLAPPTKRVNRTLAWSHGSFEGNASVGKEMGRTIDDSRSVLRKRLPMTSGTKQCVPRFNSIGKRRVSKCVWQKTHEDFFFWLTSWHWKIVRCSLLFIDTRVQSCSNDDVHLMHTHPRSDRQCGMKIRYERSIWYHTNARYEGVDQEILSALCPYYQAYWRYVFTLYRATFDGDDLVQKFFTYTWSSEVHA